jgi:hypothetical protein
MSSSSSATNTKHSSSGEQHTYIPETCAVKAMVFRLTSDKYNCMSVVLTRRQHQARQVHGFGVSQSKQVRVMLTGQVPAEGRQHRQETKQHQQQLARRTLMQREPAWMLLSSRSCCSRRRKRYNLLPDLFMMLPCCARTHTYRGRVVVCCNLCHTLSTVGWEVSSLELASPLHEMACGA